MPKAKNDLDKLRTRYYTLAYRDRRKGFSTVLSYDEFVTIVSTHKCIYCGYVGTVGLDRIDPSKGHIRSNVVPCCWLCNYVKSNVFTYDEMCNIIGPVIARIRQNRLLDGPALKQYPRG